MMVILIVLVILSFFWLLWCIKLCWKKYKIFRKTAEIFVNYLEIKKDFESLHKIGEYNECGHKERRQVFPSVILFLRSKYKETNEIEYKNYASFITKMTFDQMLILFGIFLGIAVFSTSLTTLFTKLVV
jgi:hypothetical protein